MHQVYFLSILCTGLSGFLLFTGLEGESYDSNEKFSLRNSTFHLVLGIICAITGVLKLLLPVYMGESKPIYFFGDLVPALACIAAGIVFVFGIFRKNSITADAKGSLDRLGQTLLYFRKSLGIALMAIAVLHFLFPQALFI